MYHLCATIKAPACRAETLTTTLQELGVSCISIDTVPYDDFVQNSRLNWDCVFEEMWTDHQPVVYLNFSFPDSDEGRAAAYQVEFRLPQIPLNLRYESVEGSGDQ
jgi:hypothetical protein